MKESLLRKRKKKGFTLIELIVVVAILGILAAIAIPRFSGMKESANESAVKANLKTIETAVQTVSTSKNVQISSIDSTGKSDGTDDVYNALGMWPKGPGTTTYTVSGGVATASLDATIPYPASGATKFDGIDFTNK